MTESDENNRPDSHDFERAGAEQADLGRAGLERAETHVPDVGETTSPLTPAPEGLSARSTTPVPPALEALDPEPLDPEPFDREAVGPGMSAPRSSHDRKIFGAGLVVGALTFGTFLGLGPLGRWFSSSPSDAKSANVNVLGTQITADSAVSPNGSPTDAAQPSDETGQSELSEVSEEESKRSETVTTSGTPASSGPSNPIAANPGSASPGLGPTVVLGDAVSSAPVASVTIPTLGVESAVETPSVSDPEPKANPTIALSDPEPKANPTIALGDPEPKANPTIALSDPEPKANPTIALSDPEPKANPTIALSDPEPKANPTIALSDVQRPSQPTPTAVELDLAPASTGPKSDFPLRSLVIDPPNGSVIVP